MGVATRVRRFRVSRFCNSELETAINFYYKYSFIGCIITISYHIIIFYYSDYYIITYLFVLEYQLVLFNENT